jgi:hypothetical protein
MKLGLTGVAAVVGFVVATMPAMVFADQSQADAQIKAGFEKYMVAWNNANPEGVLIFIL